MSDQTENDPATGLRKRLVDSVSNKVLLGGLAHWESLRGTRPMPTRKDLDPTNIPRGLLPHILLVEAHHGAEIRFRFRLIGTHITTALQRDMTGRWLDELYTAEEYQSVTASYLEVLETGAPTYSLIRAPVPGREHLVLEAIDLPLETGENDPDIIMALCHLSTRDFV